MQFIQSDTNEFTDVRFSKYIFLHSYNQLSYRFFSQRRLLLVTSSGIERFLPFRSIGRAERFTAGKRKAANREIVQARIKQA